MQLAVESHERGSSASYDKQVLQLITRTTLRATAGHRSLLQHRPFRHRRFTAACCTFGASPSCYGSTYSVWPRSPHVEQPPNAIHVWELIGPSYRHQNRLSDMLNYFVYDPYFGMGVHWWDYHTLHVRFTSTIRFSGDLYYCGWRQSERVYIWWPDQNYGRRRFDDIV